MTPLVSGSALRTILNIVMVIFISLDPVIVAGDEKNTFALNPPQFRSLLRNKQANQLDEPIRAEKM